MLKELEKVLWRININCDYGDVNEDHANKALDKIQKIIKKVKDKE